MTWCLYEEASFGRFPVECSVVRDTSSTICLLLRQNENSRVRGTSGMKRLTIYDEYYNLLPRSNAALLSTPRCRSNGAIVAKRICRHCLFFNYEPKPVSFSANLHLALDNVRFTVEWWRRCRRFIFRSRVCATKSFLFVISLLFLSKYFSSLLLHCPCTKRASYSIIFVYLKEFSCLIFLVR